MSSAPLVQRPAAPASLIDPSQWFALQVVSRRNETRDIVVFDLALADGATLPSFTAGAHLEVQVGGLIRHYSLCSSPDDRAHYRIAVQRETAGRGGSALLCDTVGPGDTLAVRGPFNHFALQQPAAQPPLLLAGGIGVTPVLCMALELTAAGLDFELHFSGRSLEHMAFLPLLRSGVFGHRVHLYADDGRGVAPMDLPTLLGSGKPGRHLYVCGPGGMIDAADRIARAQGWAGDHIHFERFGAPAALPPGTATGGDTCEAFEVEIASTGRRIPIAADQSIVTALAAAGVHIPMSCEVGVCGSCRTRVLAGVPDHRDLLLSPEEQAANTEFTPCCSRSKTPLLVLDL
ncbi:PDR/VanB family oxidoreductase [Variovorax arabinosiphilus]|uniref:PDR/VanB family oxidoreductase n=1 Tax=Variovorax arabinosiphilus TaxID=3053498 RepID=UPI002578B3A7|nr:MULTISPECIES: PDR/VanB family oxidoreductase [unclassified Variovorax]MDM0121890.1 PDR/VanB family oxidoreductase [Variovorax sp. J2L1-78]MDM0131580.1 PDR/VanB family oxidoreductase [Variovorax sp. J2L1-63]MDM0234653.1 PDR/VanB family oxidoreductase [Variovorax sp. J2R1-6]